MGRGTDVQISIMDKAGNHLPVGEAGEVVIKGPNVITGYENNPEANAASFIDGWFRTGDQGVLDEEGYLTLVARIKELINRGGEKNSSRRLADYQRPRQIHITDKIPRTATGKIQRGGVAKVYTATK